MMGKFVRSTLPVMPDAAFGRENHRRFEEPGDK